MRTVRELNDDINPRTNSLAGMVRRMLVTLTTGVLWQIAGFRMPDGSQEVTNAEPFTGIGVTSRPPNNGVPEAIVVLINGIDSAKAPVIVAVRDQQTRAAIISALTGGGSELNADETVLHTSQAVVYMKADGTIEARAAGGAAVALALKSDVENAKTSFDTHTHSGGTLAGGVTGVPGAPMTSPVGTTILKGQ